MTLEVSHGTVTHDNTVYALTAKPTDVGGGTYEATGIADGGSTITARWFNWQPEWSELESACDWPTPDEVVHLP